MIDINVFNFLVHLLYNFSLIIKGKVVRPNAATRSKLLRFSVSIVAAIVLTFASLNTNLNALNWKNYSLFISKDPSLFYLIHDLVWDIKISVLLYAISGTLVGLPFLIRKNAKSKVSPINYVY